MKKICVFLLIILLVMSVVSCGKDIRENESYTQGNIEDDTENDSYTNIYSYSTYSDCWKSLVDANTSDYKTLRSESSQYGALYEAMLGEFASENALLYIPMNHGKELPLQNRVGFPNISLLANELYGMPWLLYHCVYNDTKIGVRVTYPSILNNEEVSAAKTAWEVLKVIAPNAPLPDNFQSNESYRNVYEKELMISGEKVLALIQECNDNTVYVSFLLKDVYVIVCTYDGALPDEFWKTFALVSYNKE